MPLLFFFLPSPSNANNCHWPRQPVGLGKTSPWVVQDEMDKERRELWSSARMTECSTPEATVNRVPWRTVVREYGERGEGGGGGQITLSPTHQHPQYLSTYILRQVPKYIPRVQRYRAGSLAGGWRTAFGRYLIIRGASALPAAGWISADRTPRSTSLIRLLTPPDFFLLFCYPNICYRGILACFYLLKLRTSSFAFRPVNP